MIKVISAFRVVRDFPPLKVGEVFEVSRGFAITSLDTRVGIKIVKELFKAAVGEPAAFELAYRDTDIGVPSVNGVVLLDMATYDCPTIDIRGPVLYEQADWCDTVKKLCAENDRAELLRQIRRSPDSVVLFATEPLTGCLCDYWLYPGSQSIVSSSTGIGGDSYLAVEAHVVVDRGYLTRKTPEELRKLYSGRLDGYVAKLTVVGEEPTCDRYHYNGSDTRGTFVYYSGGNGYIVCHPSSAYVYKTKKAAEDSFAEERSYWSRRFAGGARYVFSLGAGQKVNKEILTTDQLRDEIWGKQTGINYFAEVAR